MNRSEQGRGRRWGRAVVGTLSVLLIGTGLGWAASTVLTPPVDVLTGTPYTYVDVVPGEVGSSIQLNTIAVWAPVPAATNQAIGTVTSVDVAPGQAVVVGTTLYTVNLRPVIIALGETPAFRTLAQETTGADVTQLQQALTSLNLYSGKIDGEFGSRTTMAVKAWQKAQGVLQDGLVQPGDIVFVPTMPARVLLDTEIISRGATLVGGENAIRTLAAAPAFTLPVSGSQAAMMPTGTRVKITAVDNGSWEGYVDSEIVEEAGVITITLVGKDGGTICGDTCAVIPVSGQTLLPSVIITVEPVSGLTVPTAALLSEADGTISVVDEAGVSRPVTVLTSARGMSVIEGVANGTSVRIPATVD